MSMTPRITPDSLLTLEAYARIRKSSKAEMIAHRRRRTVRLGEHVLRTACRDVARWQALAPGLSGLGLRVGLQQVVDGLDSHVGGSP